MIRDFWNRMFGNLVSNKKLSRPEQVLYELKQGQGTARQISDRSWIKLSVVRTNLSGLHNQGLIRATGDMVGHENVWEVTKK